MTESHVSTPRPGRIHRVPRANTSVGTASANHIARSRLCGIRNHAGELRAAHDSIDVGTNVVLLRLATWLTMRPHVPSVSCRRTSTNFGFHRFSNPTITREPDATAAATIASASTALVASGFSISRSRPRVAQSTAGSRCAKSGVATTAPVRSGCASSMVVTSGWIGTSKLGAMRARTESDGSQIATRSASERCAIDRANMVPRIPPPTTPIRGRASVTMSPPGRVCGHPVVCPDPTEPSRPTDHDHGVRTRSTRSPSMNRSARSW